MVVDNPDELAAERLRKLRQITPHKRIVGSCRQGRRYLSNFYCLPGRAEGSPKGLEQLPSTP